MKDIFRRRCDELIHEYVNSSLKRENDARELCALLDERIRKDRRSFRHRIASLERSKLEAEKLLEGVSWEVEQLYLKLRDLGFTRNDRDIRQRLDRIEAKLFDADEGERIVSNCEMPTFENPIEICPHLKSAAIEGRDELGWIQI